ncbi:family 78 glycoside hydrolase catalytic domain [Phycicoccus sp. Soil802]|uniref:family 78 glycoside hydrolase catalytic domain n=1 Tax=Phycicoccus sp. Soil802 TaxID=1736414 RepID=UPI0007038161|nr:family 78 glycoside hydrolase catalytic domain [Phycicoccus sp. Soil802]KRF22933.1 alpha-L-rhamnosidase [Phycicoccus sp. Soil802]
MTHEWSADLIAPDKDFAGAPLLRKEFALDQGHGPVVGATLFVTAHGIVEPTINGTPVSDEVLTPGWTSYEWRLRYRSYDVTPLVSDTSVLGLALGNGWFRGRLGWSGKSGFYGAELAGLAELHVEFEDGHRQLVGTDATWQAGPSATLVNDLYDGQTIDARLESSDWTQPGAALEGWSGVHVVAHDGGRLEPYLGPPVRRQEVVAPVKVWTSPAGATLVDFGQNLVGWLRFSVQGEAGSEITVRHAEVLEHDELGTRPLRTAEATDRFILSGGVDTFEPTKTFHGFRYAEVSGWPGQLTEDSLEAVVVHSELERTGTFESSDELLNQLHRNVVWGLKGNFLDVPTDCPQRDERLGWTGDIAAFAPTAAYLYDVSGFLSNWLVDVDLEQSHADGMVPFVVPDVLKYMEIPADFPDPDSTAVWSDAAAWVPWALWTAYGDKAALERQYPAMTAHAHRVEGLLSDNDLWDKGFQFGDWLDPQAPPDQPFKAKADNGVVATACYYRTLRQVAATAEILGIPDDAGYFSALAERVRSAFQKHYVTEGGRVLSDCATVYALAIEFGLLDEADRQGAGDRLAELVRDNGFRISTGFAGTPFVTDALTSTGHLDDAYQLLLERECPSWLYPVTMGATTVWERWDSMLPDGTINPGEMTSFNHYALGAVADWMHRTIAGIAPLAPGYDRVLIAPRPGGGLTWAKGALDTRHGTIASDWSLDDQGTLSLRVTVPQGVEATVRLPDGTERVVVGAGDHQFTAPS